MRAWQFMKMRSVDLARSWRKAKCTPKRRDLPEDASRETFQRPTFKIEHAGFAKIFHPSALPGTAFEAWYGLKQIRPRNIADQFALTGLRLDLRSPRTVDAGAAKAWASQGGFDAWICIGKNLSWIVPGQWSRSPAFVPVLGGSNPILPTGRGVGPEIITFESFPAGSWTDNPMQSAKIAREFGLETYPFRVGERLDVALVMLASRVTTVNTNYVDGYAQVELKLAEAFRSTTLGS